MFPRGGLTHSYGECYCISFIFSRNKAVKNQLEQKKLIHVNAKECSPSKSTISK